MANLITTEQANTLFGAAIGIGGGAAGLIVTQRLSRYPGDKIPVSVFIVPLSFAVSGAVIGSAMIPGGEVEEFVEPEVDIGPEE